MGVVRNAVMGSGGAINCEVEARGVWHPYTARADDPNERGRKIYAIALAQALGEPEPDVGDDAIQPPDAAEIMRRVRCGTRADKLDLARRMRAAGFWDGFRDGMDSDTREDWDMAGSIWRNDPVFGRVMAGIGMTDAQIDAAFGIGDHV
ncbi:MAG: hypothetical protein Tp176DCM1853251_68 [Prokaryotic dsDNA virus sp.]|nr:MAG: hypothetical protein Tp176DCM1853251_68 [Prokaryotic dsDNA virus sp.]|tara:strand:- start:301 stop:747 length:447 start_codon:yes stop_codon:yes gene_type:complete